MSFYSPTSSLFFFSCLCYLYGSQPDLPSFPTRRSSDLLYLRHEVVCGRRTNSAGPLLAIIVPPRIRPKLDRKSTRLNSSHLVISYAVFCLKKKKINNKHHLGGHRQRLHP